MRAHLGLLNPNTHFPALLTFGTTYTFMQAYLFLLQKRTYTHPHPRSVCHFGSWRTCVFFNGEDGFASYVLTELFGGIKRVTHLTDILRRRPCGGHYTKLGSSSEDYRADLMHVLRNVILTAATHTCKIRAIRIIIAHYMALMGRDVASHRTQGVVSKSCTLRRKSVARFLQSVM